MNDLKETGIYPQITIDVNNIFTVYIFDLEGNIKFEDIGVGRTYEESRQKAKNLIKYNMEKLKGDI